MQDTAGYQECTATPPAIKSEGLHVILLIGFRVILLSEVGVLRWLGKWTSCFLAPVAGAYNYFRLP